MADNNRTQGAPPSAVHIGPEHKKSNWLPWLLLALGLLTLIWFLATRRGGDDDAVVAATTKAPVAGATTEAPPMPAINQPIGGLGTFLAGTDEVPRTFIFDTLNFDTAKADIRPADQGTVDEVARVLGQFPTARARIIGYADARGDAAANEGLGQRRAEALKAALVAKGVAADRLTAESGGENDPVDSNATASGQAENRRTEFVITSR